MNSKNHQKYLLSIVGPTAIGKTTLSIELAKHYTTEIISADSRQFFKEMQIGTAVPSKEELVQVKHHFIQHRSIIEDYNAGMFEQDAIKQLNSLFKQHDIVVMVGGSGLYTQAVTEGLDDFPKTNDGIRQDLINMLNEKGIEALQKQLKKLDVESYGKIDINNHQRLIRALEVTIGTKKPYSSYLGKRKSNRNFKVITIGLTADRATIYDRINKRVDLMIENGLVEEVRQLAPHKNRNALNTVGYKELFNYLDGKCSLEFAIAEIKKNTRRFAKRQLTWLRKKDGVIWFDNQQPIDEIIHHIDEEMN